MGCIQRNGKVLEINYSKCLDWFYRKHPEKIKDYIQSVSPKQIECKKWLVNELKNIKDFNNIYLIGGWFGYPLINFLEKNNQIKKCVNIDIDKNATSVCFNFSKIFNHSFVKTVSKSIYDHTENFMDADLIINTSSEHMFDLHVIMKNRNFNKKCIFAIQSNNMKHIHDHTNCSNSLEEFKLKTKFNKIIYEGIKKFDNYERYMLIGSY